MAATGAGLTDLTDRSAGGKNRFGGPVGGGEIDAFETAVAVLRCRGGQNSDRWSGYCQGHPRQPACPDRHGTTRQQPAAPLSATISLWSAKRDTGEILAASKQAVAHDFIVDLKDLDGNSGYEALVGERGVKLSGGERQRISLARVILKNAPILLLDEATSALDSEIEAEILNTLYGMMQGKTVIAIAHRLSTIARMDRIIVMDNGSIVEKGPHQALLAQNGLYATFWARQSGGFIDIKAVI